MNEVARRDDIQQEMLALIQKELDRKNEHIKYIELRIVSEPKPPKNDLK